MEKEQTSDQFGFRPGRSINDILAILESMNSRSHEWHVPIWIVSLDLKKAFDRIEFNALFQALAEHNIPAPYIKLLKILYP